HRLSRRHAHSQQTPENDWGPYTLHAVEFAFYMLNEKFGTPQSDGAKLRTIHPGQGTIVIAASVSNGGGAALAAAEQDSTGMIRGVVAGEPQIQVTSTATIQRGGQTVAAAGKPLYDYTTTAALYQPCASLSASATAPGFFNALASAAFTSAAQARCGGLKAKGLLGAGTLSAQADESLARLQQAGWEAESNLLHNSHLGLYATPAVAVTYANA